MNKSEWYDGLNNIDAGIVEEYIEEKKRLAVLRKKKNRWLKIGAVAACFAVIICSLIPLISNRIEEKPFRLPTDIDNIVCLPLYFILLNTPLPGIFQTVFRIIGPT